MQLFKCFGVDVVGVQHFDALFASLGAQEFVHTILVERLKIKKVWVGRDLRVGQGRKGRVDDLIRWGRERKFEVGVMEPVVVNGVRVSSSHIRQLLAEGRGEKVEPMLGRYNFVYGRVVSGHRRGRELGFQKDNISCRTEVLPSDGIYATLLQIDVNMLPSVCNV